MIRVDEASASNKIVRCLISQKDTLALSSLIGCSSRNSSTVVSSYESKIRSSPEEQKEAHPIGSDKTLRDRELRAKFPEKLLMEEAD